MNASEVPAIVVSGRFRVGNRRLSRRLGAVGYVALSAPWLLFLLRDWFGVEVPSRLTSAVQLITLLAGPALLLAGWAASRPRWAESSLVLQGRRIELHNGKRVCLIPVDRVVDGFHLSGGVDSVALRLDDGTFVDGHCFPPADKSGGITELLAALGLDTAQRALALRTSAMDSPAFAAFWVFLVLLAMSASVFDSVLLTTYPLLFAFVAWVFASLSRGSLVTVGIDGLLVEGGRQTGLVPWVAVREVEIRRGRLRAVLANGRKVSLGIASGAALEGAETMKARIAEARLLATQGGQRNVGGRAQDWSTITTWREATSPLRNGAGYRDAVMCEDDLVELVRSGATTTEERVGAALALMAGNRERNATRVRIAMQSLADPNTRRLLEKIASGGDDEAVEEALRGELNVRISRF